MAKQEVSLNTIEKTSRDEDIQLRKYLEQILARWPFLLILTLAAAILALVINMLIPPVYSATAVISIPAYINGNASNVNLLQSDDILSAVKEKPGIPNDILDHLTIAADDQDRTTLRITVEANTGEQAALEANTWAEEGIKWLKQNYLNPNRQWVTKTKADLESADRALLDFLKVHNLDQYTLIDIRIYEGMYSPDSSELAGAPSPLELSSEVRLQLRSLLRAQGNAAGLYSDALDNYNKRQLQIQSNGPAVLQRAIVPDKPPQHQTLTLIKYMVLAAAMGLLAGIVFVLIWDWWRSSARLPASKT
jgi:uncharacterized protein involved in exopolysaccharide biosynthesis